MSERVKVAINLVISGAFDVEIIELADGRKEYQTHLIKDVEIIPVCITSGGEMAQRCGEVATYLMSTLATDMLKEGVAKERAVDLLPQTKTPTAAA